MKLVFRWFGKEDKVTLDKIKQIPVIDGIVSAIYDVAVGEVWSEKSIKVLSDEIKANNLNFEVVESVPVSEDIKLHTSKAKEHIAAYKENIKRLAKVGVKVICYNFMPVFDWLRSELARELPDGSNALYYDNQTVLSMNPLTSELSLPGWDESYDKNQLKDILRSYQNVTEEDLWNNLKLFLDEVIPVCEENDIKMAIHPDDPPWGIFGLPRIIINENNYDRFINLNKSLYNGVTFCTGSLGVNPTNDLISMIKKLKGRIHFAHLRNIMITGERSFSETAHPSKCGSLDMYAILKALYDNGFDGYIRPDHGRMIWGETGRYGYGLYDRALGAMYLAGIWESLEKEKS